MIEQLHRQWGLRSDPLDVETDRARSERVGYKMRGVSIRFTGKMPKAITPQRSEADIHRFQLPARVPM